MKEFKVGDKVKIVGNKFELGAKDRFMEEKGTIVKFRTRSRGSKDNIRVYGVEFDSKSLEKTNSWIWWLEELELVENSFSKEDLKTGMVVEVEVYGKIETYVVMLDSKLYNNDDNYLLSIDNGNNLLLEDDVFENMEWNEEIKIMKIGYSHYSGDIFRNNFEIETVIWERRELKKMSLKDIQEELGYDIEII